jgi:hypothetical protein
MARLEVSLDSLWDPSVKALFLNRVHVSVNQHNSQASGFLLGLESGAVILIKTDQGLGYSLLARQSLRRLGFR